MAMKRVLIFAGGTGGHIFPALAVADELSASRYEILWIGSKGGMEEKLVTDHGLNIELIEMVGVRRKGLIRLLATPLILFRAMLQCIKVISGFKPNIALGMGGFVSAPAGIACYLTRVPLVIHEQNSIPGLTNKILSRFAKVVLTAFPNVFKNNSNVKLVGNPVRRDIEKVREEQRQGRSRDVVRVLVIGGSRGARALNQYMPVIFSQVSRKVEVEIWHQCGKDNAVETSEYYEYHGIEAKVTEFIENMNSAYDWADFAVCRAGALTIAELSKVGLASLLVPYPFAVDDHQWHNAMYLEKEGGCLVTREESLKSEEVIDKIISLLSNRNRLEQMGCNAHHLARLDAAADIANICINNMIAREGS